MANFIMMKTNTLWPLLCFVTIIKATGENIQKLESDISHSPKLAYSVLNICEEKVRTSNSFFRVCSRVNDDNFGGKYMCSFSKSFLNSTEEKSPQLL